MGEVYRALAPNIYDVIHRVPASGGKPIPVTVLGEFTIWGGL